MNMSLLTSLHSIMDCMTYVYWRSWLWDRRAPPMPMVIPSEKPGSGFLGSKYCLRYPIILSTGSRLNRRYALLSDTEYSTLRISSELRSEWA